jgi:hypothetical protein
MIKLYIKAHMMYQLEMISIEFSKAAIIQVKVLSSARQLLTPCRESINKQTGRDSIRGIESSDI